MAWCGPLGCTVVLKVYHEPSMSAVAAQQLSRELAILTRLAMAAPNPTPVSSPVASRASFAASAPQCAARLLAAFKVRLAMLVLRCLMRTLLSENTFAFIRTEQFNTLHEH
jgi:hypothetical protein